MVVNRTNTDEVEIAVNSRLSETRLQIKLIKCAAKYIALGFVALSSTMFAAVVKIGGISFFDDEHGSNVGTAMHLMDALVNVITLYMTFKFGDAAYYKICNSLHICCFGCITKRTFLEMKLKFQEKEESSKISIR